MGTPIADIAVGVTRFAVHEFVPYNDVATTPASQDGRARQARNRAAEGDATPQLSGVPIQHSLTLSVPIQHSLTLSVPIQHRPLEHKILM